MLHQSGDFEKISSDFIDIFFHYYEGQKRNVKFIKSGFLGEKDTEGSFYFLSFLVDKNMILRYTIPNAPRTFGGLWLGFGPEYIPVEWIFGEEVGFSNEITDFNVRRNLQLLDECIKKTGFNAVLCRTMSR